MSYHTEIETALSKHPARISKHHPESYIGGGVSKCRFIGLKVPQIQETADAGFSFSHRPNRDLAKIWHSVWKKSDCFEVMSLALGWFSEPAQRGLLLDHWPLLKTWSNKIDNWAHADGLCAIYSRILEDHPAAVYPTLQTWNKAANPWLRRISVVSLLYYSSQRKKHPAFSKIISLVKPQLEFDHYYVQKAVGWTLRECGNVYFQETADFIEKNLGKLSPSAFTTATEKWPKAQKERLKKRRKLLRRPGRAL